MKFLEKFRKRKKLMKAINEIEEPLWWVTYILSNGEQSVINVFAPNHKEAMKRAANILANECSYSFKISGASCI